MSGRLKEEKDKPRLLQLFLSINYGGRDKREENFPFRSNKGNRTRSIRGHSSASVETKLDIPSNSTYLKNNTLF